MYFLDLTLPTLEQNLALDEALLLSAEDGGPEVLRLWRWPSAAVVLGAAGRYADEVHEQACVQAGVPIARRSSGGGTVLLGAGCLLYSLILRFERDSTLNDLHASYGFILDQVRAALTPDCVRAGISDLSVRNRKVSGSAQQRKRTHLLHHGTLLLDFDIASVGRYLKPPPREPDYRQRRDHADFLGNLSLSIDMVERGLRAAWRAEESLPRWPIELVDRLVTDRYARTDWTHRR